MELQVDLSKNKHKHAAKKREEELGVPLVVHVDKTTAALASIIEELAKATKVKLSADTWEILRALQEKG